MEYEEVWKDLKEDDNLEQTYILDVIKAQKTAEVEVEMRKVSRYLYIYLSIQFIHLTITRIDFMKLYSINLNLITFKDNRRTATYRIRKPTIGFGTRRKREKDQKFQQEKENSTRTEKIKKEER